MPRSNTDAHRASQVRWASSRCVDCGQALTSKGTRCRPCFRTHKHAEAVRRWRSMRRIYRGGCHVWLGPRDDEGYGYWSKRTGPRAHRWGWVHVYGLPLLPSQRLHHTCEHPWCVNPEHLVPMTEREHRAQHARPLITRCKHGHPYDGVTPAGRRYCKTCARMWAARKRAQ